MARLLTNSIDWYYHKMDNDSDQRVNNWFMMSSPFPTIAIVLCYIIFVKRIGPTLMKNHKPFELTYFIIVYNAIQVLINIYLFHQACTLGWMTFYSYRCQPIDFSDNPIAVQTARGCWWYYLTKLTELLDTVFFVLRKKNKQISTLHVIHHSVMPVGCWVGAKFFAGGQATFLGLLNTFVHIVMYSYYLLAALGPKMQPYLWWKKYITLLQMAQFLLIIVHTVQSLILDCDLPKILQYLILAQGVMFFVLFSNFYYQTYLKKAKEQKWYFLWLICIAGLAALVRQAYIFATKSTNDMARLLTNSIDWYYHKLDNDSDQRVNNWFMMSSPFPTIAIVLCYIIFVQRIGPTLMKNHKPFDLTYFIIVYNAIQVLINIYLFHQACTLGWMTFYSYRCQPIDYSDNPIAVQTARGCWWYYLTKFTELLDTVFFVLRKKNKQISTLHVIHHSVMPVGCWFGVKFFPGGQGTFFGLLNTFVHIVMYSYYFLAALGPKMQPYLWWKKYITLLQMAQFLLVIIHTVQSLILDCDLGKIVQYLLLAHAVMFFVLFSNFYYQTYLKKAKVSHIQKTE